MIEIKIYKKAFLGPFEHALSANIPIFNRTSLEYFLCEVLKERKFITSEDFAKRYFDMLLKRRKDTEEYIMRLVEKIAIDEKMNQENDETV